MNVLNPLFFQESLWCLLDESLLTGKAVIDACNETSTNKKDLYAKSSWWRHQMKIFSALLALCVGNHRSPVNSPHIGQWRRALMFSFMCTWTNGWVNKRDAGYLIHHRAYYDVTLMWLEIISESRKIDFSSCTFHICTSHCTTEIVLTAMKNMGIGKKIRINTPSAIPVRLHAIRTCHKCVCRCARN